MSGCCILLCFKPVDNTFSVFQIVSGCHALLGFQACWECLLLAHQWVSGCCVLLHSKFADDCCFWPIDCRWLSCFSSFYIHWWLLPLPFRLWVTPHWVSSLLMMCIHNSSVGEWLLCLWVLSLLTIPALGSSVSEWLLCLAISQVYWWYLLLAFSMSVAVLLCWVSCLLTTLFS